MSFGREGLSKMTHARLLAAAASLPLALSLGACSKPAAVSDPTALVEPASASDANPSPPSSMQTADASPTPSNGGGCRQVQVGGGYQPGVNGGPGTITPGQTMTVCSAPTPTPAPRAVAATPAQAATPAAPAPARAEPAAPDTD